MRLPGGNAPAGAAANGKHSAVRQAVRRFTVWSLVALILVAGGTVLLSEHIARDEAVRDARLRGAAIAHGVAAPLVNAKVRAGDPDAIARLGEVIGNRMLDGSVSHIKLWSEDGTVIWSDESNVSGRSFPLPADLPGLFGTHDVIAELSEMDRPEDAGERNEGPLLEVFAGATDAEGVPLVFEAHMSPERLDEDQTALFTELLPLALGALLVFQLTMLPLAMSLARRVERAQAERAELLRRALMSSDLERRRIAQLLHDGVIQDLAGLSYALPTVSGKLPADRSADAARRTADQMSFILRRVVASLRSLLTDIYPPDLEGDGLTAALNELAQSAAESDVEVELDLSPGLGVPTETGRLVYRVVREGLRNVVRHANAAAVKVTVHQHGDDVTVRVTDNGQGLHERNGGERGHLGVKLLADTVSDLGGQLDLRPGETGGAVLEASFQSSSLD
jgi:signal transduction histidine kinase